MKGRIQKGETRNPGGMTKEQREARDLLNADLRKPEVYKEWLLSYRSMLKAENAVILVDYANRVGGKPKEHVEVTGDADDPVVAAVRDMTKAEMLALVRSGK